MVVSGLIGRRLEKFFRVACNRTRAGQVSLLLRSRAARRTVIGCPRYDPQPITFRPVDFFALPGLRSASVVLLVFLRQDERACVSYLD